MTHSPTQFKKNEYDSFVRGIKIGAMAAGARQDTLFKGENAEFLMALQKKGGDKASKYKANLELVVGKNSLKYGGIDKASTGYRYAKLRTQKYLDKGMLNAVKREI